VLLFFGCQSNESNTGNTSGKDTTQQNDNPDSFSYTLPSEVQYVEKSDDIITDILYPIGWSADGMFSYISEPADEATGFYYFTFNIVNTKTGKTEWSWKIDEKNEQSEGTLKDTWEKNKQLFVSTLEHFKIHQQQDFQISQFPFSDGQDKYQLILDTKYKEDEYGYGFKVAGKCNAILKKSDGKQREVFSKDYQNNMILNVSLVGFFKNPTGKEIAAIIKTTRMGYEGPPHVVAFQLVYADLSK
jgi:hypothetical protein